MNKIELVSNIVKILLHWIGLFGWAYCFLLLMEVVICKDVRLANIERLLSLSFKRRYRIFLRNLKNFYYLGSVLLMISSFFALCQLSLELWDSNNILNKSPLRIILSPIITLGIALVYRSFGHKITYIQKLRGIIHD